MRATVDAFSGEVDLYLTDEPDPIARAWAEAFPTLFRPTDEMPAELRDRLRYPADLFDAQATAYERFHTTRPDLFVSDADAWSRPIALSGPIEVAGDVDFDESDEDDLRLTMQPGYIVLGSARAQPSPGSCSETYYTPAPRAEPRRRPSPAGSTSDGQARLGCPSLLARPGHAGTRPDQPAGLRHPAGPQPAGLRNLEIRDLDKSSLDTVLLGRPHILCSSRAGSSRSRACTRVREDPAPRGCSG